MRMSEIDKKKYFVLLKGFFFNELTRLNFFS